VVSAGLPLSQIIVHDLAEAERQIGQDVDRGYHLQYRQFGDRRQGVGMERERARTGG